MKSVLALAWLAAPLLPVAAPAHHNSAALYRLEESLTITGTVTDFRFLNPHARITLDVIGEDGTARQWMAEGANVIALRLHGWTGDEVKPGDRIHVTGAPSRDGSPRIEWTEIVLADGTRRGGGNNFPKERDELFERLEQQRRTQPAGN
jgi:DNA/RNA endonuclease YhcR with UshA esterase domain